MPPCGPAWLGSPAGPAAGDGAPFISPPFICASAIARLATSAADAMPLINVAFFIGVSLR
ncbi:hypothetical protein [Methylocella sp.]|uniref:hypothetical protein n=1 Tax=Methylocella sp. TaxID=1978226 RepID=UPI003C23E15D